MRRGYTGINSSQAATPNRFPSTRPITYTAPDSTAINPRSHGRTGW
ncbi:hypothetical protein [Mycobacterium sp.]